MHNERCMSGSEGGLEKPTGRKAGRALRSDPTVNPVKRNVNHDADKAMTIPFAPSRTAFLLSAALLLGACACPARADDNPAASPEADASRLVEEVLRRTGGGDLADWTRSIMDRALKRSGEAARQTGPGQVAPLPAERHAAGIAGGAAARRGAAEVLIFTSLSVPAASWRQWSREAAATGVPLVMRGVGAGGLPETAKQIRARLGGYDAGIAIDPRLFRLFDIVRVPAVVVVPGGVPACRSRGCSDPGSGSGAGDPAPPHDLVAGNIGLMAALEAVASEGDAGRAVARALLERLREGSRP